MTKGEEGEVTCDIVTPDHGTHVYIQDGDVEEAYEDPGGISLDHPVLVMLSILITIVLAIILYRVYRKRIDERKEK